MTITVPGEARLWIGVLAAPLAWGAAEWAGFVASSHLCDDRPGLLPSVHPGEARVANIVICGVFLLIALVGLVVAIDNYRRTRDDAARLAFGRASFMAIGGFFSSVVFTIAIVLFAMPALIVNVCNQVR
ncbi:MAG TPA: hypothetical protein VIP11_03355 [Gemmatimonadaceae bacterium]